MQKSGCKSSIRSAYEIFVQHSRLTITFNGDKKIVIYMSKNAVIVTHFGTSVLRIGLLCETTKRILAQNSDKTVYIVENILPDAKTRIPKDILGKVRYVRTHGNPILWQKEAMYNAGAEVAIRDGCDILIFMDSDIVPATQDWLIEIDEMLKRYHWVHCAQKIFFLTQNATLKLINDGVKTHVDEKYSSSPYTEYEKTSYVYNIKNNIRKWGFPGGIWATTAETWKKYGRWDPFNILGGGDYFHLLRLVRAHHPKHEVYGNILELLLNPMLDEYAKNDINWTMGCLNLSCYHLFHGSVTKRGYTTRYKCVVKSEHADLFSKRFPEFQKSQLIDLNHDMFLNRFGLVELSEKSKHYKWFFLKFAEYFMSRDDADLNYINEYLDFISADFRIVSDGIYTDGGLKLKIIQTAPDEKDSIKVQENKTLEPKKTEIKVDEEIAEALQERSMDEEILEALGEIKTDTIDRQILEALSDM